ncbi:hypothetical protein OGAPHI_002409 [Ogataea philodendri]|uniref:Endoplasmic reticulum membrane protein 65 n=1 Tax=Ogataea philodendri TaxID=1378263 RepID=A0A9P8PBF4_9ASCO|nr:uncharacterized protein OGAPHI_002409 [Ogataea philodendri]KAH3668655.1 hypothetical protein OGAPHI_002409 [Ogataea philodendri]
MKRRSDSSTPVKPTPSAERRSSAPENQPSSSGDHRPSSFTLWKLLLAELNTSKDDQPSKSQSSDSDDPSVNSELLVNFVKLPVHLEKFMCFGLVYCLIVFLKQITVVPLRSALHSYNLIRSSFTNNKTFKYYSTRTKNDFVSMILIISSLMLLKNLDSSKIYHNIRAGTAVKLYFMVGVLEIADRLLSAVGQDILKVVYFVPIFPTTELKTPMKFLAITAVSVCYLTLHSYVLAYQVMALNVAINSYSNALLTLILSNQFAELKSSVFKRSEREGLFQVSCADLNERFQMLVMLFIISSRNLFQVYTNTTSTGLFDNLKPHSWYSQMTFSTTLNNWIGLLMGPMFTVIGSEVLVDWLKHSYITKFNRIKPTIYGKYVRVFATDYVNSFRSNLTALDEYPEMLLKRTGLPVLTLSIVFIKMCMYPWVKHFLHNETTERLSFLGLLLLLLIFSLITVVRLVLSLGLLRWSNKILRSQQTKQDFVRGDPNVTLTDVKEQRTQLYEAYEKVPPSLEELRLKKGERLDSVVRFDMVDKRIW